MTLGDGIRRNIASVDPSERALFIDAFKQLNDNNHKFPGTRNDSPAAGGVSWWFKQDELHQATHVHGGREFVPWHRELMNRIEQMLRQINPLLSLHYWDWTQDPRAIPNANIGGGTTGILSLFTPDFMGHGGPTDQPIGEPWLSAKYYDPNANPAREDTDNPADTPRKVFRHVSNSFGPATSARVNEVVNAGDFVAMRNLLEPIHNDMHGFVAMGDLHRSFEDPFVFLLHSYQDGLFARWQTDPAHPERLDPNLVYGTESGSLDVLVEPWSTGHGFDDFGVEHFTRPWWPPENQGNPHTYKHPSIVTPPQYDTNFPVPPTLINFWMLKHWLSRG